MTQLALNGKMVWLLLLLSAFFPLYFCTWLIWQ